MLLLEALHVVPVAPPARFADNGENRDTDIGQDVCAIAGMITCPRKLWRAAYMNEASERVLARTGLYASMLVCSAIKD